MKHRLATSALTLAITCALSVVGGSARAAEATAPERLGISGGVLVGFGTNDKNFGLGGRVGYTFARYPVYVGAEFIYHFGYKDAAIILPDGSSSSDQAHELMGGLSLGWDFTWKALTIRPNLGFGIFQLVHQSQLGSVASPTDKATNPYVAPGVVALLTVPKTPIQIGADIRLNAVIASAVSAYFGLYGTAGVAF
jgi:hypothetical protein